MNWQKQEGGEKPKRCEVVKDKESKCFGNEGVMNCLSHPAGPRKRKEGKWHCLS